MTGSAPASAAHFPADGASAGAARRFVATTLGEWGLDELEETACLLVSELVSNVVLHAETDLDVCLGRGDGRVRVEVHDRNPTLPQRKFYSPTATTGRGMLFIAELSHSWGAEATIGGKVVWFELDEAPPPPPALQAPGTEFRLEDWEHWGPLDQPTLPVDPPPGDNGRDQGASGHADRVLVGCP